MPVILESSQYIGQNVRARKKLIEPTYWEAVMSQSKELPANLARLALRSKEFKFRVLDGIGVAEKVWSETNISSSRNGKPLRPLRLQVSALQERIRRSSCFPSVIKI